ncbi:hypothetical protein CEB3_c19510 [Peptococcaceae bacterium CEB3]|nr:hypothetical protein CEB3_c19510 [Peptococcaceae bacterium CEB3]
MSSKNIEVEIQGNFLIVRVNLAQRFGLTKTGKSELIATTGKNIPIGKGRHERMIMTVFAPKGED